MVAPHDNWDDAEDGYTNGGIGIFVHPSVVQYGEGFQSESVGVPEDDANACTVSYQSGLETGYGTHKTLVHFENPRDAWEYANLTTHYIDDALDSDLAISELQGRSDPIQPSWTPDGIITDLDAEEVMRKMLGHYEFRLDDALEESVTADA